MEVHYANEFKELIEYANSVIKEHPELKNEIKELLDLCQSEIEEGGSVSHEIELCKQDIKQLYEND